MRPPLPGPSLVPLPIGVLWQETLHDTRALMPLALPVAGVFVMLPEIAVELFGPPVPVKFVTTTVPAESPTTTATTGAPPQVALSLPTDFVVVDLLLPTLVALIAQLAIIRLALDRRRGVARSVGEALAAAFGAWPFAVVALVLTTIPIGFGLLALIVPGLYLAGRLTPAVALVVDGRGPLDAVEASWALTAGNGWRVIAFALIFVGWSFMFSQATGFVGLGVAKLLHDAGAGAAGAVVAAALDGVVAALFSVVNAVGLVAVYLRLRR